MTALWQLLTNGERLCGSWPMFGWTENHFFSWFRKLVVDGMEWVHSHISALHFLPQTRGIPWVYSAIFNNYQATFHIVMTSEVWNKLFNPSLDSFWASSSYSTFHSTSFICVNNLESRCIHNGFFIQWVLGTISPWW